MKYLGSKNRIAKYLLPIILKDRKPGQWYVEPFVGGANMIDKVSGKRLGGDSHPYLIKLYHALQKGWEPPKFVSEKRYNEIRENPDLFDPALVAYCGFNLSFGSDWLGVYRQGKKGDKGNIINMQNQSRMAYNNVMSQMPFIKDVQFIEQQFFKLKIPPKSIVYCDPPYELTTSYKLTSIYSINAFWDWVRLISKRGHSVYVSSYKAPYDFVSVWSMNVNVNVNVNVNARVATKARTEHLFRWVHAEKYLKK